MRILGIDSQTDESGDSPSITVTLNLDNGKAVNPANRVTVDGAATTRRVSVRGQLNGYGVLT